MNGTDHVEKYHNTLLYTITVSLPSGQEGLFKYPFQEWQNEIRSSCRIVEHRIARAFLANVMKRQGACFDQTRQLAFN